MTLHRRFVIMMGSFALGLLFGAVLLISGCTSGGASEADPDFETLTAEPTAAADASVQLRCGDGICLPAGEDSTTCPQDCRVNPLTCGDGVCNRVSANENCFSCASDCGACITDVTLIANSIVDACGATCETSADCPDPLECAGNQCRSLFYCGTCGDRVCDATESQGDSCPTDCGAECTNDGVCDPDEAFVCADCFPIGIRCGDNVCNLLQENSANCAADCACNQDEVCDPHEAISCADCRNNVAATPTPTAKPDGNDDYGTSGGTTSGTTTGGGNDGPVYEGGGDGG